jgi:putative methyltransferase (TIGR04325 family)
MREWVYSPQGWVNGDKSDGGWYDRSIAETQRARWLRIVRSLQGTGPLSTAYTSVPPESTKNELKAHNVIMSYAYVLSLATENRRSLSVLDWGGGVGLYHLLSIVLFPKVNVEYHCYDTPSLCKLGREFWPNDVFYGDSAAALSRKYDLVVSSSSLQYFEKWQEVLGELAKAALGYLYIARLRIVQNADSFVAIQRCYRNKIYGYNTELVSWFINKAELLDCAKQAGMKLVREFVDGERWFVGNAPERHAESRGFLFTPS